MKNNNLVFINKIDYFNLKKNILLYNGYIH